MQRLRGGFAPKLKAGATIYEYYRCSDGKRSEGEGVDAWPMVKMRIAV